MFSCNIQYWFRRYWTKTYSQNMYVEAPRSQGVVGKANKNMRGGCKTLHGRAQLTKPCLQARL